MAKMVWIDGVEYTTTQAYGELSVYRKGDFQAFREALEAGGVFKGRRLSLTAPEPAPARKPVPAPLMHHCDGRPLLAPGYCVHRLGVDHGDHWR